MLNFVSFYAESFHLNQSSATQPLIMDKNKEKNEPVIGGIISVNIKRNKKDEKKRPQFHNGDYLVLPTRNLVLFPGVALPIQLGRKSSITVAEYAKKNNEPIAVFCQLDPEKEDPQPDDLYTIGTLARVVDILDLPNGIKTAIVEGWERVFRDNTQFSSSIPDVLTASVRILPDEPYGRPKKLHNLLLAKIREVTEKITKNTLDEVAVMHFPSIDEINDLSELVNIIAVHLPFEVVDKQRLLALNVPDDRAVLLLELLMAREEEMNFMANILEKARDRMEENQRNAFIQQQIDVLRGELSDEDDDIYDLQMRSEDAFLPEHVQIRFNKELNKLKRFNPQSPDYSVQYSYLDTLLSIPWSLKAPQTVSLSKAKKTLESHHFGMTKVKNRILEQIALILNNPDGQAPILCFVGPPGVGKTSLGQSIAEALGLEFQRVSLGGLHDEAEIRGHRRTYIGSMPGRIIEAIRKGKTVNPVIMLDEIDKIGKDYKGDPEAALLEVLDPEQNCRFHDNYIDVDYDLSSVLFIATANTLSTISKPLLDRIEVIEISGYSDEEKLEIATKHILPKLYKKFDINPLDISISENAIKKLIEEYTSESGVRQLEKRLAEILRKKLLQKMRKVKDYFYLVLPIDLQKLLGPAPYKREKYEDQIMPGVVTGLAWTAAGGETLLVEAATAPGKGNLVLTGNLGDVMKESATLALEWVKVNALSLGIDSDVFKDNDIHIHFPEGAIPKDGPSAGITIATAIVSALTRRLLNPRIAMTGEITLRGKVLPVGGIKEKILAAKRAGIKTIILSQENRPNVEEIEKVYLKGLNFVYVENVSQVLEETLKK